MKTLLLALSLCLVTPLASAEEYEIESQSPDITPNDGFFDVGTTFNPYVVKRNNQRIGTIAPRVIDITPNDGLFDAGTTFNPYVLKIDD